jgi:hypothetical protein
MSPPHDLTVRSGRGWTIVETAGTERTPGTHDIGGPLGIADGTMLLVVLRAAERWAADDEATTDVTAILSRQGRMLVEFDDGSTQPLRAEQGWSATADRVLTGVVNMGTELAEVLVFAT